MSSDSAIVPPVPQYLNWSEKAITWDREDQPALLPSPSSYALVLDPLIVSDKRTWRFSRVLIYSSSSLNLLYRDTMEKLGIEERHL